MFPELLTWRTFRLAPLLALVLLKLQHWKDSGLTDQPGIVTSTISLVSSLKYKLIVHFISISFVFFWISPGFGWDSLEAPTRTAFATLGWTAELWRGGGAPESELKSWSELSSEEQIAAGTVCYSALTWDQVPLTEAALWSEGDTTDSDISDGKRSAISFSAWVAAVAALLFL